MKCDSVLADQLGHMETSIALAWKAECIREFAVFVCNYAAVESCIVLPKIEIETKIE